MLVAVFRDLDPADEFHDEVWVTGFGRPCIENLGDIGVIHQRQCLPLGFKPGDHVLRVHSRLDYFQCDPPPDRFLLLRHVNHTTSALTYLLEQLVMANAVTRFFSRLKRVSCSCWPLRCGSAKEIARLFVSLEQGFHSAAELDVSVASRVQITISLFRRKVESFREDGNVLVRSTVHFTNG